MAGFDFQNGQIIARDEPISAGHLPNANFVLVWVEAQALASMVVPRASDCQTDRLLKDCVEVLNSCADGTITTDDAIARLSDLKRLLLRHQKATRKVLFHLGAAEWFWTLFLAGLSYSVYFCLWWNDFAASGQLFENIVENGFAAVSWGLLGYSLPLMIRYHYLSEALPFEEVVSVVRGSLGPFLSALRNLGIVVIAVITALVGTSAFNIEISLSNIAQPDKMLGPGILLSFAAPRLFRMLS